MRIDVLHGPEHAERCLTGSNRRLDLIAHASIQPVLHLQAFKSYDEAGVPRRTQCLKYLVLASMLMGSQVSSLCLDSVCTLCMLQID